MYTKKYLKHLKEQAIRSIEWINLNNPFVADSGSVYTEPYRRVQHQSMCGWLSVFWGVKFAMYLDMFPDNHIVSMLKTSLSPVLLKNLSRCTTLDQCITEEEFALLAKLLNVRILIQYPPFTTEDGRYNDGQVLYNSTAIVTICLWFHDAHYTVLIEPHLIESAKCFNEEWMRTFGMSCKLDYLKAESWCVDWYGGVQPDTSGDENYAISLATAEVDNLELTKNDWDFAKKLQLSPDFI